MARGSHLSILGPLYLLGACAQLTRPAGPLGLDAAPRILGGLWVGESAGGHTLLIDAHPGDPNELAYAVEGTFRLDTRDPVAFSGDVQAAVARPGRLQPQTSPERATLDAVSSDGLWRLLGDAPVGVPPRFEVVLGGVDGSYTFTMTAPTPTDLAETRWTLEALRGAPVAPGTEITLAFTDQRFGGSSGCNGYGAPYLATATTLTIVGKVCRR